MKNLGVDISFTIAIIGDQKTGKSSLLKCISNEKVGEEYNQSDFLTMKEFTLNIQDKKVGLNIWDVPGNKDNIDIYSAFIKSAQAFIFLFSLDDPHSLSNLHHFWYDHINCNGLDANKCYFVGNKSDLKGKDRKVHESRIKKVSEQLNLLPTYISTVQDHNVMSLLKSIAWDLLSSVEKESGNESEVSKMKVDEVQETYCACSVI